MRGAGPLLSVEDLSLEFRARDGTVRVLDGVGFTVGWGKTVGLVGESGSGKTITALAIMGVLPPTARVTAGRAVFKGTDLLAADERTLRRYRGSEISMTFQQARAALNPIRPVGRQIEDVIGHHTDLQPAAARSRTLDLLAGVQIPDPGRVYGAFPFELSGGMCQRVMIAMAVACSPSLLIADEPATGLDVCTQAAVLELIGDLARQNNMATLLISHDLGLLGERADRVVVMHAGHVVETAPTAALLAAPRHPYTAKLIASSPRPSVGLADLVTIPGTIPDFRAQLPPCRFSFRCDRAAPECDQPPLPRVVVGPDHVVACRRPL
ncbi:MAG: ABC transporter ATP-binding protein [bacterium]|nr:ABC transporter ATP-binding protein [bacterium]